MGIGGYGRMRVVSYIREDIGYSNIAGCVAIPRNLKSFVIKQSHIGWWELRLYSQSALLKRYRLPDEVRVVLDFNQRMIHWWGKRLRVGIEVSCLDYKDNSDGDE